jgi:hypothetical protein
MHAQLGPGRQAARDSPRTLVRGPSVVAAPVRGRPCKADGSPHRSQAPIFVRYASVDTATQRSTARQGDTRRNRAETARIAENSQLAGRFPRVWQVLGSNQRRLSRRFYSTLAPPESPSADQRIRRLRRVPGPPPSAMRPCAPDFGAVKATDGGGKGHGRGPHSEGRSGVLTVRRSGMATVPLSVWQLTCHFRLPTRCRRRLHRQGRARARWCRGRR